MLNRQKAVLQMFQCAGRPLSHLELTKWCFLLAQETSSGGGASFYQFVPYDYGPFSFSLFREMRSLVDKGFLLEPDEKSWALATDRAGAPLNLSPEVKSDISALVRRLQDLSLGAIIDHVYEQYPWYTVNSKKRKLAERPVASIAVYTAGYERLSVDGFLDMLVRNGIARLVDVRRNPVARRYGFHKSTLNRLCSSLDIEYVHVPELGIPSELRRSLASQADYDALFKRYETTTLKTESAVIDRVSALVREKPCVLVCMESDPERCHRSRLAAAVSERTGLPVESLSPLP